MCVCQASVLDPVVHLGILGSTAPDHAALSCGCPLPPLQCPSLVCVFTRQPHEIKHGLSSPKEVESVRTSRGRGVGRSERIVSQLGRQPNMAVSSVGL